MFYKVPGANLAAKVAARAAASIAARGDGFRGSVSHPPAPVQLFAHALGPVAVLAVLLDGGL